MKQRFRYQARLRADGVEFDGIPFSLEFDLERDGRRFEINPRGESAIRQATARAVRWERKHRPHLADTPIEVTAVRHTGGGTK